MALAKLSNFADLANAGASSLCPVVLGSLTLLGGIARIIDDGDKSRNTVSPAATHAEGDVVLSTTVHGGVEKPAIEGRESAQCKMIYLNWDN
ncbi:hypothetical protein PABG_11153 [Paracoccidioides brasiliensis Pb03]|nr:hypothetical protein PABG_11153 [Paracoccidioides brasiliensis Pb03]